MKKPERPSAVLVVAILQICFGSLGLLNSTCAGGILLMGGTKAFTPKPVAGAPAQPDVEGMIAARVPYYKAWQAASVALAVASGTMMLVGGIGLMRLRPWARYLTIAYAGLSIVRSVAEFVFALTVTVPVTREVLEEIRKDPNFPAQMGGFMNMMGTFAIIGTYFSLVVLIYPIAILIIMFLPHVREAFRRGSAPKAAEEEHDDDGYEDDDDGEEAPPDDRRGGDHGEGIREGD